MNIYILISNFAKWQSENPRLNNQSLGTIYLQILNTANKHRWTKEFEIDKKQLMFDCGIKSHNTFKKSFDLLAEIGFINIERIGVNHYNRTLISLANFATLKNNEKIVSMSVSESNSDIVKPFSMSVSESNSDIVTPENTNKINGYEASNILYNINIKDSEKTSDSIESDEIFLKSIDNKRFMFSVFFKSLDYNNLADKEKINKKAESIQETKNETEKPQKLKKPIKEKINDFNNPEILNIIKFAETFIQNVDFKSAYKTFDLLINKDKFNLNDIRLAIYFGRNDDFWQANFLSVNSLRKKGKDNVMKINKLLAQAKYKKIELPVNLIVKKQEEKNKLDLLAEKYLKKAI